jgi:predicted nucleic acid-binding protein
VNRPGILLDTGPIVALLSTADANHDRTVKVFGRTTPPFRCCEPVLAEACFLMSKVDPRGPAEVLALGRKGVYEMAFSIGEHLASIETLLRKYADQGASLADVCLIRAADLHDEPRIFTFDQDFRVYRWARNRKFEVV